MRWGTAIAGGVLGVGLAYGGYELVHQGFEDQGVVVEHHGCLDAVNAGKAACKDLVVNGDELKTQGTIAGAEAVFGFLGMIGGAVVAVGALVVASEGESQQYVSTPRPNQQVPAGPPPGTEIAVIEQPKSQ